MLDNEALPMAGGFLLSADPGVGERASTVGIVVLWGVGIGVAILLVVLILMGIGWILENAPWLVGLWIIAIPACAAAGYIFRLDALYGVAAFMAIIAVGIGLSS